MSFILEALRKSENERQRQSGPDFASIPETAERSSASRWPLLVGILILFNLVLLVVVFWPDPEETVPRTATQADPNTAVSGPEPPARREPPTAQAPVGESVSTGPARQSTLEPDTGAEATAAVPANGGEAPQTPPVRDVRSLSDEVTPREDLHAPAAQQPAAREPGTVIVADQPIADERATQAAVAPPAATAPSASTRPPDPAPASSTGQREGLPTANELRLQGFLTGPPLHLDLHVYYPEPSRRVVFISGQRYREGDRVNGGAVVREIVPDGVVLEDRGRRFLLGPD